MITLYGIANSRAFRCIWMLEEAGVPYENVPTDFAGGSRSPEYLKINPNGRVPCLVDDDLVLFESLAINLYLARKYATALWPTDVADEARALQWSFWSTNELDGPLSLLTIQGRLSKEARNVPAMEQARRAVQAPLRVLDDQLARTPFLLGKDVSIADINCAAVAAACFSTKIDLAPFPNVQRWLAACMQRKAAVRAVELLLAVPRPA